MQEHHLGAIPSAEECVRSLWGCTVECTGHETLPTFSPNVHDQKEDENQTSNEAAVSVQYVPMLLVRLHCSFCWLGTQNIHSVHAVTPAGTI